MQVGTCFRTREIDLKTKTRPVTRTLEPDPVILSGGIGVKFLEVVDWSQLESVAARVLKLLQASSSFIKLRSVENKP